MAKKRKPKYNVNWVNGSWFVVEAGKPIASYANEPWVACCVAAALEKYNRELGEGCITNEQRSEDQF